MKSMMLPICNHHGGFRAWRLCVLVSRALCTDGDWQRVVRAAAAAPGGTGADCFQLREKDLDDAALLDLAKRFVAVCREHSVAAVINDRVDIALLAGADGVHLGQTDLSIADARHLAGDKLIIGVSTTNLDQARQAVDQGADYCGVGPMFATQTKPQRPPATLDYLRRFRAAYPDMPHLAIGGIDTQNIASVIKAGAQGIAVSRAVCSAPDPGDVAQMLARQVDHPVRVAPNPGKYIEKSRNQ